jgi:hypothetical protein
MKYAVIVFESDKDFAERSNPATAPSYMGAYLAYSQAMAEAGVAAGGAGLEPPSMATRVKVKRGEVEIHDGPFADTHEQVGGFFVIDVPDLDSALKWAARCPAASRAGVEVRPLLAPPPGSVG